VETDIDFAGPRLVFAVQGNEDVEPSRSVLRRSDDGGAAWTTVARERAREPFRVQFADRRHGALVESVDGPGAQVGHELLATTTDGGRTWGRHGLPADSLDPDDTVTPTPAILGRDVWIGHTRSGVVWHTDDGGLRWTLTTAPRSLDPGSDGYLTNLLVGPGLLMVSSAAGPVESRDGGRTWTTARWPSGEDLARDEGRGAYVIRGNHRDRARLVTPTGSQPLGLPAGVRHLSDVAFADARDGLLVAYHGAYVETPYVTHDGGGTWAAIGPPSRRPGDYLLAPGVIVDVAARTEWVTTDDGASWQPLGPVQQYDYCVPSRASALDVWITCNSFTRTKLFYSGDGGRTWTRHVSHRQLGPPVGGTGGPEAWATGVSPHVDGGATRLWHTTDGGATWTQVWVSLPQPAPAREIDCAIMPSGVLHAPLAACR
jgi:photosystem II stability/assembly factor-like uncharacterized protein